VISLELETPLHPEGFGEFGCPQKKENAIYKFDPANGDWCEFLFPGAGRQETSA
jgi:hypothetical protein